MFVEKDLFVRTEWWNTRIHTRKKQRMWRAGWCDSRPICSGQVTTSSQCWCSTPWCNARCPAENFLPHAAQTSTKTTQRTTVKVVENWRNFQKRISTTLCNTMCAETWWTIPRNTRQSAAHLDFLFYLIRVCYYYIPARWRRPEQRRY